MKYEETFKMKECDCKRMKQMLRWDFFFNWPSENLDAIFVHLCSYYHTRFVKRVKYEVC